MSFININHLREIGQALKEDIPGKAARKAQDAAKETFKYLDASKQAATQSSESAKQAAAQAEASKASAAQAKAYADEAKSTKDDIQAIGNQFSKDADTLRTDVENKTKKASEDSAAALKAVDDLRTSTSQEITENVNTVNSSITAVSQQEKDFEKTFEVSKIEWKPKNATPTASSTEESAVFTIAEQDVTLLRAENTTSVAGNGKTSIQWRYYTNGAWTEYEKLKSIAGINASKVQFKFTTTISDATKDSASVNKVVVSYAVSKNYTDTLAKAIFDASKEGAAKIYIGDEEQLPDDEMSVKLSEMSDDDVDKLLYGLKLTDDKYKMYNIYPSEYKIMTEVPDELDTSKITNMNYMFFECRKLKSIQEIDTVNVVSMVDMFCYCNALAFIPKINTSNVRDMSGLFQGCWTLTSIPQMDTSKVKSMKQMFYSCRALTSIPWEIDMQVCTDYLNMFDTCKNLTGVKLKNVPKDFDAAKAGLKDGQYTIISYRES